MLNMDTLGSPFSSQLHKTLQLYEDQRWKESEEKAAMLLEITWEHLNTGYWKDVPITWRYVYTVLSMVKAVSECAQVVQKDTVDSSNHAKLDLSVPIKTCDMGLLMGAPLMDNVLSRLVIKLQEMQRSRKRCDSVAAQKSKLDQSSPDPLIIDPLPKVSCPSLESFQDVYMRSETPVIIKDAIDFWPAFNQNKWSVEYIKQIAGCRTVPIEIGSKYTEESWSQSLMTVKEFIEKYIELKDKSTPVGYLAQHQLFDQIPEDISVPDYCSLGEDASVDINAWFGPQGTVSPLHTDPKHNLLAQVVGRKYLKLYDKKYTDLLYPHEGHILFNTSQIDAENIDHKKFPLAKEAKALECILEEGEMLYIPPGYWHYVRSLTTSFSISFWWQ